MIAIVAAQIHVQAVQFDPETGDISPFPVQPITIEGSAAWAEFDPNTVTAALNAPAAAE